MTEELMHQTAPFPTELADIVSSLEYRPGWRFNLESIERDPGSSGLTFIVRSLGYDTYHPERGENYGVLHYFPVPPATYNRVSWLHWVFDRLASIEMHECAEFFKMDNDRPYAPHHGPGNDPYVVFAHHDVDDTKVRFDGTLADTGSDA